MDRLLKGSERYLNQIRNNVPEKIEMVMDKLNSGELPRDQNGKIIVLEIGTGGGESIRSLDTELKEREEIKLIALDVVQALAAKAKKEGGVDAVVADAGALPFKDESLSAVNASAVFHEVSSYGTRSHRREQLDSDEDGAENRIYGRDAIRAVFAECERVLMPDGILTYRDPLVSAEDIREEKEVTYYEVSWKQFCNWFLQNFINSGRGFYEGTEISTRESEEGLVLTAPVGIQRELQRHYLMLRDYLRNARKDEFGINITKSEWMNKEVGLKSITFSIDKSISNVIGLSNLEVIEQDGEVIYGCDSDQFDKMYDELMNYYFMEMESGTEKGKEFESIIEEWRAREGSEYYVYGNISDLIDLSCRAVPEDEYVLFPESSKDIKVVPRYYYDRYLQRVADNPEKDGKQMVTFKKMKRIDAIKALKRITDDESSEWGLDSEKILKTLTKMESSE